MNRAVRGAAFIASIAGGMTSPLSERRVAGDPGAPSNVGSGSAALYEKGTSLVNGSTFGSCTHTLAELPVSRTKGGSKDSRASVRAPSGASSKANEVEYSSEISRSSQQACEGKGTFSDNSEGTPAHTPLSARLLIELAKKYGLLYNVRPGIKLPEDVWRNAFRDLQKALTDARNNAKLFWDKVEKVLEGLSVRGLLKAALDGHSLYGGYDLCWDSVQKLLDSMKTYAQCVQERQDLGAYYLQFFHGLYSALKQRSDFLSQILADGGKNEACDALQFVKRSPVNPAASFHGESNKRSGRLQQCLTCRYSSTLCPHC